MLHSFSLASSLRVITRGGVGGLGLLMIVMCIFGQTVKLDRLILYTVLIITIHTTVRPHA